MSWIWVDRLVGPDLPARFRARWLGELFRQGLFVENNLSVYFSPNTHLLGEALVLHALGLFFRNSRWKRLGAMIMTEQIERQANADGSHVERSAYYHLYALDMFLLHATLAQPGSQYLAKLERMAAYLDALLGPSRKIPLIGDDDGGRLFHPYGARDQFARASLATAAILLNRPDWIVCRDDLHSQAAWWIDSRDIWTSGSSCSSRFFPDASIAVMCSGPTQVIVTAASFGPWNAGHSHAATLGVIARVGDTELLIDPGTYTYTADPQRRNWFRSTEAHNTIRIDRLDQATPGDPFLWRNLPTVEILSWETGVDSDVLDARCRYRGFTHRRRVEFHKPDVLAITDYIDGPPGAHNIEQLWHLGSPEVRERFDIADDSELVNSFRSLCFGEKQRSMMLRVYRRSSLPARLETRIDLSP